MKGWLQKRNEQERNGGEGGNAKSEEARREKEGPKRGTFASFE